jgi:hypothetical protein
MIKEKSAMTIEHMITLIKNGYAYFGVYDKAGVNIGSQLAWLNECLLNNPQAIDRQFVIVL